MLQFLFDTDHLTLLDRGHTQVRQRHSAQPSDTVGISAVTIQEYLKGRLAALTRHQSGPLQVQAYANLLGSLQLFQQFPIVAFDDACENEYQHLRCLRLRIGTQDLKIAAVALVHRLTVVTRNRRDFGRIPGLGLEDWSL
jgi:tRNA(fMet)-specific endonuclease VapC